MSEEMMPTRQTTGDRSIRFGPGDPGYLAVIDKRFNKRFRASPDYVRLVSSTDQVVSAVGRAGRGRRRVDAATGGDPPPGARSRRPGARENNPLATQENH